MSLLPVRITAIILFFGNIVYAQVIDNTASYRMIDAPSYLRIHYENDYFSGKDQDYTQGVNLEWVNPILKKNPLRYILITPKNGSITYGLAGEHNAYTPKRISSYRVQYGDRPFAAGMMLKSFAAANFAEKHYRITSSLSLGMIGPVAGAREIQQGIHQWIDDVPPHGWMYQIRNDVIVNYEAGIEKNLFRSEFLLVNAAANARLGTLSSKFSASSVIMIGKFNRAITSVFGDQDSTAEQENFYIHFYAQPYVNGILYDAMLQGGLFNKQSVYTIDAKNIERLTYGGNLGLNFTYKFLNVEYFQTVLSKEFVTGRPHWWGGVRIGVIF